MVDTTPEGEKTIMSGDIIRRVDVSGHFPTGDSSLTPVGTPPPFRYPPPVFHLLSDPRPVGHARHYVEGAIGYQSILGQSIHRHYPSGRHYFATDPSPLRTPPPFGPLPPRPPPRPPPVGPLPHGPPPHGPPHGPLPPSSRHGHTSCKMHGNCKTECFLPGSAKSSHARCHVHVGMSNSEIHQEISKLCNIKQL